VTATAWRFDVALLDEGVHRYRLRRDDSPGAYGDAIRLLEQDAAFRRYFSELLAESPYAVFRWETPPVTVASRTRAFEFVLVDSPELDLPPDPRPFLGHFRTARSGVTAFDNLGGDARLVVPCPDAPDAVYAHLAAFVRGAPETQQHELWQIVAREMRARLSHRPIWLSTAGGGVAWLHVRLDQRPKYYAWRPYATTNGDEE
jgi:hypothetical protein